MQERHKADAEVDLQKCVDEICINISKQGTDYQNLSFVSKAELFEFNIDDNETNLKMYMEVMKKLGVQQFYDEMFEDYLGIYDAGITTGAGGKVIDRGR